MNESLIHSLNQFVKNNDSFRNKTFHSLHDLLRFVKKKKKCLNVNKSLRVTYEIIHSTEAFKAKNNSGRGGK